jgi:hypothetical protein
MSISLSGSLIISGSLTTTGTISMSGSIASASYALNATTGAYANTSTSASYALNATTFNNTASSVFATTGSNNFTGTVYHSNTNNAIGFSNTTSSIYTDGGLQVTKDTYLSSSLYIKGNLTVYGTQSVSYITSSTLNITTNLITVNTATPSVRFGGIAVQDSGSTAGLTGSLLWDSQNNSWLYDNPSGSGNYDSAMVIMGPRNSSTLGSEQGLNCNYLIQGHGHHHTTSSGIFHDGTNTCIPGALLASGCIGINCSTPSYTLDVNGTGRFTNIVYALSYQALNSNASGYSVTTYANTGANGKSYDIGVGGNTSAQANRFYIYDNTANALRFYIDTTGAATFSSSVSINGASNTTALNVSAAGANGINLAPDTNSPTTNSARVYFSNNSTAFAILNSSSTLAFTYGATAGSGTGTPGMTMTSSGNVGIGAPSPNTILDVNGTINVRTNGYQFGRITTNNNDATNGGLTLQYINSNSFRDGIVLNYAGNVGIGTTSPNENLQVNSTISLRSGNGSAWGSLRFGVNNASYYGSWAGIESDNESTGANVSNLKFFTSYGGISEKMRITAGGNFYYYTMAASAGTNTVKWNTSTGQITYDTSSARYKNNIRDSVYGLGDVMKLKSKMFEYKEDSRTDVGLIAEEVYKVIPELVGLDKEGLPHSVSYDRFVSVLVKAIQEQQQTIQDLTNRLNKAGL